MTILRCSINRGTASCFLSGINIGCRTFREEGNTQYAEDLSHEEAAILVNSVCPGYFHTERVESLAQKLAAASGGTVQDMIDKWSEAAALKRIGDPAEFGPLVAFLCSEKAAYMTGTAIAIDGGLSRGLL